MRYWNIVILTCGVVHPATGRAVDVKPPAGVFPSATGPAGPKFSAIMSSSNTKTDKLTDSPWTLIHGHC